MCTFHQLFCHLHARHWVGWDLRRKSNYKNKFVFVPQPKSVNQHCSLGLNDVRQLAAEESMSSRNSTFTDLNQSDRNFTSCSVMIRINHVTMKSYCPAPFSFQTWATANCAHQRRVLSLGRVSCAVKSLDPNGVTRFSHYIFISSDRKKLSCIFRFFKASRDAV